MAAQISVQRLSGYGLRRALMAGIQRVIARRDEIKVSPIVEAALGLNVGELSCKVEDFLKHVYGADRG